MKPGVVKQNRRYEHPRELVWRALTEPELLERWLMKNDFRAEVGHQFTFRTDPGPGFDGVVHCEVLELVPLERMVWSWRGGPLDTKIRFELTEEDGGRATRLEVEHSGFRGLKARIVQRLLGLGWRTMYGKRIPALLDELARGAELSPNDDESCMDKKQGAIVRVLGALEGEKQ